MTPPSPRSRPLRRLALFATLVAGTVGLLASGARASEKGADSAPAEFGLTSPADPAVVDRLVTDPRCAPPATALRLVTALRAAGGYAASDGLVALLARDDEEVKVAALEALAALGLRAEKTAIAVRRAAGSSAPLVRRTAVEALGRIGDGRDVQRLLEGLAGDDADLRSACLRALRTLSGMRMPPSPVRWAQWWSKAEPRARTDFEWAAQEMVVAVEADGDLETFAAAVARSGWVDLQATRQTAIAWMRSTQSALRVQGFRLVATLRLADLADDVRMGVRFGLDEAAWAAVDAARALGVPTTAR